MHAAAPDAAIQRVFKEFKTVTTFIASVRNLENNIGTRLTKTAQEFPDTVAVAVPRGRNKQGKRQYDRMTFQQLDLDSSKIAASIRKIGIKPGTRLVLMVRPGLDFISLTYALFKAGVVVILIDPGMGRQHMVNCLEAVQPEGFIAIPLAHIARLIYRNRFPLAKINVTVGRRFFWGGKTLRQLRGISTDDYEPFEAAADDPAAIIFTSGSTGPPKGVLYRHGNFSNQVDQLQERYQIQPGEIDLPGFPLFALFNGAMGVTTIIPDMDPTKPASVDPKNIIEPINDWNITQAFGSPALWNVVGRYCEEHNVKLPTLRRVLSAGAPVPSHVVQRVKAAIPGDGDIFTPYGCTEGLPVASISGLEILAETAEKTMRGHGTCVGQSFSGIDWQVIRIRDAEIKSIDHAEELPNGEIGELLIRGPVVTSEYVTRTELNRFAKIKDGDRFWHRMGDVGYLDDEHRFWFCGRKSHRVITSEGTMFTVPCESIFNNHPSIYRSALVGIGSKGNQRPLLIAEPWPDKWTTKRANLKQLIDELYQLGQANSLTYQIDRSSILLHRALPVDIRHNSKIFREQLVDWAEKQIAKAGSDSKPFGIFGGKYSK